MPYLKLAVAGGGEVELSGNSAEAFDDLIKKHGKIAVPNYALTWIAAFFDRRKAHIEMQKAKQMGNAAEAERHATICDALEDKEDDAKEAYDKAVESGGPDLPKHPLGGAPPVEEMKALVVEDAGPKEEAKLTKVAVKKMKPPELKEALKERGLSTQGNKNDLMARLLEHEGL